MGRWWNLAFRAIRRHACRSYSNPEMTERLGITAGSVLLLSDGEQQVDLALEDGCIRVGAASSGATLDARGLLVLPGIVDIHGDAFERQIQPRPGIGFAPDIALA